MSLQSCRKQKLKVYIIVRIIVDFIIGMCLALLRSLLVFIALIYCLVSFILTYLTLFTIYYSQDLMVRKCLNFYLSRNVLISPSLFKDSFARRDFFLSFDPLFFLPFLGWQCFLFLFLFMQFEYISPLPQTTKVSDEKFANSCNWKSLVYDKLLFSFYF